MSKKAVQLPEDYRGLPNVQPLVGEIGCAKNFLVVAPASNRSRKKAFLEAHTDSEKLAPLVREIGVATYRIHKRLPKELQGQLPSPEQIAKLLEGGGEPDGIQLRCARRIHKAEAWVRSATSRQTAGQRADHVLIRQDETVWLSRGTAENETSSPRKRSTAKEKSLM